MDNREKNKPGRPKDKPGKPTRADIDYELELEIKKAARGEYPYGELAKLKQMSAANKMVHILPWKGTPPEAASLIGRIRKYRKPDILPEDQEWTLSDADDIPESALKVVIDLARSYDYEGQRYGFSKRHAKWAARLNISGLDGDVLRYWCDHYANFERWVILEKKSDTITTRDLDFAWQSEPWELMTAAITQEVYIPRRALEGMYCCLSSTESFDPFKVSIVITAQEVATSFIGEPYVYQVDEVIDMTARAYRIASFWITFLDKRYKASRLSIKDKAALVNDMFKWAGDHQNIDSDKVRVAMMCNPTIKDAAQQLDLIPVEILKSAGIIIE